MILAVDPAKRAGAAALVSADGRRLLAGWTWKPAGGSHTVEAYLRDLPRDRRSYLAPTLNAVGNQIRLDTFALSPDPVRLVVEALFVGKSPKSALTLAEATGEVMGPLRGISFGEVARPFANLRNRKGWRDVVLGARPAHYLRGPKGGKVSGADAWAAFAMDSVPRLIDLGADNPLRHNEHFCEAALIGRWLAVTLRGSLGAVV